MESPKRKKIKFAVVHLFDIGSSHPEVEVTFHTTRKSALEAVREIIDVDPLEEAETDEDEWEKQDGEGWVRIDEVK